MELSLFWQWLIGIVAFLITWAITPSFWSIRDIFDSSPAGLFITRLIASGIIAFLAIGIVNGVLHPKLKIQDLPVVVVPADVTPSAPESTSPNIQVPAASTADIAEQARPSEAPAIVQEEAPSTEAIAKPQELPASQPPVLPILN